MDGLIGRLRQVTGYGSLALGLILLAAWVKSTIDGEVIPALDNGQREAISLSGFIEILRFSYAASETDRLVPQITYSVRGLFSEATMRVAPNEVNPGWTDAGTNDADEQTLIARDRAVLKSAELLPEDSGLILQGNHVFESGGENWMDGFDSKIIQASATQSVAPTLPAPGTLDGLSDIEPSMLNGRSAIEDAESTATLAAQWQCCGIRYEKYNDEDGTWSALWLIPHGVLFTPLFGLSLVLLIGPWRKQWQLAMTRTSRSASETKAASSSISTLFQTHTGRIGLATLFAALLLTAAWVRSLGITDVTSLIVGPQTRVLFISGVEGLVVKKETLDTEGMESGHTTRTGAAHQPLHFRPESASLSGGVDFDLNILSPAEQIDGTTADLPISVATPPALLPTNMDWIGQSIDWCGLHVSLSPDQTTIMLPYAFFVIPLTLLSAALLFGRRFVVTPLHRPPGAE